MSGEHKGGNPAPEKEGIPQDPELQSTPGEGNPTPEEQKVKYESFLREQRRAATALERAKKAEEKAEALEQAQLEAEGNLAKANEKLKEKVAELTKKNLEIQGASAYQSLSSQVEAEAAKLGCIDANALKKLMDLESINVDVETMQADPQEVIAAIEMQKKDRPYLFQKKGPQINTQNPNAEFVQKKKSVSDMSPEEQQALAREIDRMEGKTLGWK